MLSAFGNSLKIPELRKRIFFTLIIVVIVRLGVAIPLPGIDYDALQDALKVLRDQSGGGSTILAMLNIFSGGGLEKCALFALGIMPYISASIMMQLLTAVVPQLNKLSREDGGREKINQYTRLATIAVCLIQGFIIARNFTNPAAIFLNNITLEKPLVPDPGMSFILTAVVCMTAGTMLLMWLGDQVTERGVGNGISLIIAVNIISALPGALVQVWKTFINNDAEQKFNSVLLALLITFFFLVIASVIAITQAHRRISIQYAKRVIGRKMIGGQTQYMPLKVNYANVMPIIFAQAILVIPSTILSQLFPNIEWIHRLSATITTGWPYYLFTAAMIFFFSYFWVAMMFQPQQIADDLKKNGGYIPGVRPGKATASFLDSTMSKLTFAGAIFLTLIAILPNLVNSSAGISYLAAQFFGGTSLLIIVGVLLEIMRQVETHLLQRHYDGFLKKGKIRGRYDRYRGKNASGNDNSSNLLWLYVIIGIVIIIGTSYFLSKDFLN